MMTLRKKPSYLCSAFFVLTSATLCSLDVRADVRCYGNSFLDSITRSEISGISGAGADKSAPFTVSQNGSLINQTIDLNISVDVDALSSGRVIAESSDWVWRLTAENKDKLTGFIIADYQFNSIGGTGKVCSASTSCLDVVSVQSNVIYNRRPNGRITQAETSVTLVLDLSNASQAGNYQADLTITLHKDSVANPSLCP